MATSSSCYFSNKYSNCRCQFYSNRTVETASFYCQRSCVAIAGPGLGFLLRTCKQKKWLEVGCRRFGLVGFRLSSSLSVDIGLDSQSAGSSHLPWVGPLPGDIAEVEAYCRIFRAAEQFHNALMDALSNRVSGECGVSNAMMSEDKPLLEDKIFSILGCMVCLINKGREDVLTGRSSMINTFRELNSTVMDDNLPPLATFRSEMKSYCESLHVALEKYLTPGDDRCMNVWRKLQRLKNVCYDSGFPRGDDFPCQMLFANWGPIHLSSLEDKAQSESLEIAFWKGGQGTEESLKWLLEKGFRTIIDLRAESVKDKFYETALGEAVSSGKIELIKLPVNVGAAPSLEQVVQFAAMVSDSSKKPIYVHSKEGKRRIFSMILKWRQYLNSMTADGERTSTVFCRAEVPRELEGSGFPVNFLDDNSSHNGSVSLSQESDLSYSSAGKFDNQDPPAAENLSRSTEGAGKSVITNQDSRLDAPCAAENETVSNKEAHSGLRPTEEKNMNGSLGSTKSSSSKQQNTAATNQSYQDPSVIFSPVTDLDKSSNDVRNDSAEERAISMVVTEQNNCDVESYLSSDDESVELIERNMCASATGVVRVQSRKKAEMFLVRTDGFSCIREKVKESSLAFTHPSTQQQMLLWKSAPRTVLLLKKLGRELLEEAKKVASFLYCQEKMNVLVEPECHDDFAGIPGFGFVQTFYSQDTSDLHERVDLVACLGGDGVILHASNLFRGAVPPVVSFNLGSLGFLTSHTFDDFKKDLSQVIHGNCTTNGVYVTLRMRLRCEIFRNGIGMPGKIFSVLNEVAVDRGSNPYLSKIECYDHDRLITKVQGDGVIIATPTGSTAYSTAAGGSMVHPNVPCMLFTPICPHSLSFRPVILPDSAQLELKVPKDARSNVWVSFDGKMRQQLSRGDSVRISMSQYPLPTVNKSDQTGDWFRSLIRCLNWNERLDQKDH